MRGVLSPLQTQTLLEPVWPRSKAPLSLLWQTAQLILSLPLPQQWSRPKTYQKEKVKSWFQGWYACLSCSWDTPWWQSPQASHTWSWSSRGPHFPAWHQDGMYITEACQPSLPPEPETSQASVSLFTECSPPSSPETFLHLTSPCTERPRPDAIACPWRGLRVSLISSQTALLFYSFIHFGFKVKNAKL